MITLLVVTASERPMPTRAMAKASFAVLCFGFSIFTNPSLLTSNEFETHALIASCSISEPSKLLLLSAIAQASVALDVNIIFALEAPIAWDI